MEYEELVYRIIEPLIKNKTRCKEYLDKGKLVIAIPNQIPYEPLNDDLWEITIEKKCDEVENERTI